MKSASLIKLRGARKGSLRTENFSRRESGLPALGHGLLTIVASGAWLDASVVRDLRGGRLARFAVCKVAHMKPNWVFFIQSVPLSISQIMAGTYLNSVNDGSRLHSCLKVDQAQDTTRITFLIGALGDFDGFESNKRTENVRNFSLFNALGQTFNFYHIRSFLGNLQQIRIHHIFQLATKIILRRLFTLTRRRLPGLWVLRTRCGLGLRLGCGR